MVIDERDRTVLAINAAGVGSLLGYACGSTRALARV
jgi:hypothetical protein